MPLQAPVHPVNVEKDEAAAVRVTTVPNGTVLAQVPLFVPSVRVQETSANPVMDPLPVPDGVVVRTTGASNRTATVRLVFITSVQVVPVLVAQSPVQLLTLFGAVALAVSVIEVPSRTLTEHAPPATPAVTVQLSPAGLVTDPFPVPRPVMEIVRDAVNEAPTVRA